MWNSQRRSFLQEVNTDVVQDENENYVTQRTQQHQNSKISQMLSKGISEP